MSKKDKLPEIVSQWLLFADSDLTSANELLKGQTGANPQICYLSQQGAEKYFKAFLLLNGWKLEKMHDLFGLLSKCCAYVKQFERLKPQCAILNEYITTGRYPGDIPFESITSDNASEALDAARDIKAFAMQKIDEWGSEQSEKQQT